VFLKLREACRYVRRSGDMKKLPTRSLVSDRVEVGMKLPCDYLS
jgi:hypothetical protein